MDHHAVSCHSLRRLEESIEPIRSHLVAHPIYGELRGIQDLRWFMENHVFAVWDFMVLLKALQRQLTCVDPVWRPVGSPCIRRLINEIVLGEESDLDADGNAISHFEMYLDAMREVQASTDSIERFIQLLSNGASVNNAFEEANVPEPAQGFVKTTFAILNSGSLPAIAAAFTFGREDLIPEMFQSVLSEINRQGSATGRFRFYLARHIELDGDCHSGLARQMMTGICQSDQDWKLAEEAACCSLIARQELWSRVLEGFPTPSA